MGDADAVRGSVHERQEALRPTPTERAEFRRRAEEAIRQSREILTREFTARRVFWYGQVSP